MTKLPHEPKRIGRPPKWSERTPIRFAAGTFDAIESVLRPGEDRSDFIREAVDREVARRRAEARPIEL